MNLDLFGADPLISPAQQEVAAGVYLLRGFALPEEASLQAAIAHVMTQAPFRHLMTPGGFQMSVAMTNCGTVGWVSDRSGYRYDAIDPTTAHPWPPMPEVLSRLAKRAAASAGYADFIPDACLINRYQAGTRLTLHQDKDEQDFSWPIVSVSLGVDALFLLGGLRREDKPQRIPLIHGDVLVWGGPARLRYHGVAPVKDGYHPVTGAYRINLTFRKAL